MSAITRSILVAACLVAAPVAAKPARPVAPTLPAPVGLREIASFRPERGFIDDPVAADAKGRLVFLETDASTFTAMVVVDDGKVRARLPLGDAGDVPLTMALVGTGETAQVFIVQTGEDGRQRGTLYDLRGKVVRRFGPAAEVTLVGRGPRPRVTLHRTRSSGRNAVKHQLEVFDLATGKRLGATYSLDVDGAGRSDKLDFRINHWFDGWTRAVGTRGGRWDARADQRSPDVEAEYDLVAGKFVREAPIPDVVAYTQRMQVLAQRADRALFVRVADDGRSVELWREGQVERVDVDQPLARYDAASISMAVDGAGAMWLGLRVDPVNRDAVARGKADPDSLDLFVVDGNKATRRARVPVARRRLRWGILGDRIWVVERNVGFDRGGSVLTLYQRE
jgi:hypothetical protein